MNPGDIPPAGNLRDHLSKHPRPAKLVDVKFVKPEHPITPRLTVLSHFALSVPPESVQSEPLRFNLPVGREQPYIRHLVIGSEWQPIDVGWLTRVALILVKTRPGEQDNGVQLGVQPPDLLSVSGGLGITHPFLDIPRGEGYPVRPSMLASLRIRSMRNFSSVTLIAYPAPTPEPTAALISGLPVGS